VAVLEGEWVRVREAPSRAGTSFPVEIRASEGVRVLLPAGEEDRGRAFSVRAFLFGTQVTVNVGFFEDHSWGYGPAPSRMRAAETTLKGRVGQWLAVSSSPVASDRGMTTDAKLATAPRVLAAPPIWIKIDVLEK
jgi:hypothetical protein